MNKTKKVQAIKVVPRETRKKLKCSQLPHWKPHLDMYMEVRSLQFATAEDFARATEILWSIELRELPCDLAPHRTIMVPLEAVPYFKELSFTEKEVLSPDDLPGDLANQTAGSEGVYPQRNAASSPFWCLVVVKTPAMDARKGGSLFHRL